MEKIRRRDLLAGTAGVFLADKMVAADVAGTLPWQPDAGSPPPIEKPEGWRFFNAEEAATVEALADCIVPPDPQTPGGKDAGCAVFIDRQLAGPYGSSEGLYQRGPFAQGAPNQGPQSATTPAGVYRQALAALQQFCRSHDNKRFAELPQERRDAIVGGLEDGSVQLQGVDGKTLFSTLVKDVQEGFFADPVYGGNRDMCSWKMIGFPGAHYDYREWVGRHNERVTLEPVSIEGRAAWTPGKA